MAGLSSFLGLLVLAYMYIGGASAQSNCPVGFQQFETSCYQFVLVPANFLASQAVCVAANARLVEINNAGENTFLQDTIDAFPVAAPFRIGYDSRPYGAAIWRLSSSGAVSPYSNWNLVAPSNPARMCAQLNNQGGDYYDDADCAAITNFVCELNLASVTCDNPSNNLVFSVDESLLSEFLIQNTADLYIGPVNVPPCQVQLNAGVYSATIAPGTCGTTFGYVVTSPDAVTLSNFLSHTPTSGGITRSRGELVAFDCRVQAIDLLSTAGALSPLALATQITQVGFGDFQIGITFRDDTFTSQLSTPLQIELAEQVNVQINLISAIQSELDIFVDECYASPVADPVDRTTTLGMIDDDCPGVAAAQVTLVPSADNNIFNFRFPAFEFVVGGASTPNVYLHCYTQICLESTPGTVCDSQACPPARRRRRSTELLSRWRRQSPATPFQSGVSPGVQTMSLGPMNVTRPAPSSGAGTLQTTYFGALVTALSMYILA